jgi:hypothetical protein
MLALLKSLMTSCDIIKQYKSTIIRSGTYLLSLISNIQSPYLSLMQIISSQMHLLTNQPYLNQSIHPPRHNLQTIINKQNLHHRLTTSHSRYNLSRYHICHLYQTIPTTTHHSLFIRTKVYCIHSSFVCLLLKLTHQLIV